MKLKQLLLKNKKGFIKYIIGTLITTPTNLMVTFSLANIFKLFEISDNKEIIKIILVSVILILSIIPLQVLSRYLRIFFMKDILVETRVLAYKKFLNTPKSEFKKQSKESYLSNLVSDINLFEKEFFISLLNLIFSFVSFILGIIVLAYFSLSLAITTIIAALIMFIISKSLENYTLKTKEELSLENENFYKYLTNFILGLETIKLYKVVDKFKSIFLFQQNLLDNKKLANNKYNYLNEKITNWFASFYQVITMVYASYLFSVDKINLVSLMIIFNTIGTLIWGINNGISIINIFKQSILIYNKIALFDEKIDKPSLFNFDKKLTINNLNYSYDGNNIFENFNLEINKLDKVLISGESGCGKTTLLDIIANNLDDYQGDVYFDQINLKIINENSFNQKVGYIYQDLFVFNDSIKNNIILDQDFNKNKFNEIVKQCNLDTFINDKNEKADFMLVDNGSNISLGQKQRISIARELYQNKELILFDEPTSSLDESNAKDILDLILSLNKTIVVISHHHLKDYQQQFTKHLKLGVTYE